MERKQHATILRQFRRIHRLVGIFLFFFFAIVAVTGLLLGWKKNVEVLQKPTAKGLATSTSDWLPMDTLITIANQELVTREGEGISIALDKLDARPDKGIVKVIYKDHYHSLQLDAATGNVLSYEYRTSDLVEHLHEGTWVDNTLGLPGGVFKLFYTTVLGLALVTFTITGFWLWYGPKVMRKRNK